MSTRHLQVNLLGGFSVTRPDSTPVSLPLAKGTALYAYLVLTAPKMQSRDRLSVLLWTEYPRAQARANLRQTMMRLRRAFSMVDDPFLVDGEAVGLRMTGVIADARQFTDMARSDKPKDWSQALELYAGDLMAGFDVDAPAFDEWLLIERQHLLDLANMTGRRLLTHHKSAGRLDEAIAVAHRLLALDDLREDVHRTLIGLLDDAGRTDAAVAQYHKLEDLLRANLDAEPSADTLALFKTLLEDAPSAHAAPNDRLDAVTRKAVGHLRDAAKRAHQRGAHGEAATLYEQALDLATEFYDAPATIELDLRAALQREYYAVGRFENSLAELAAISRKAEAVGDEPRRVRAQCDQAQLLRVLNQLDDGKALARNALSGARALDDGHLEALANLRLAALHFHSGEYQRALPLLIVNIEVLDGALMDMVDESEPGHPAVRSRSWLTWTCAELGRFDEGAMYGEQGVALADEIDEMYALVHSRIAMGILRFRELKFETAADWLQQALDLSVRSEMPIFETYIKLALALSLAEAGQIDAAREHLKSYTLTSERAIALSTLADTNRLIGRPEVAREVSLRAIDRAATSGERGDEGWAHRAAGLACLALGDQTVARDHLEAARAISGSLRMAPLRGLCQSELERLG